MGIPDWYKVHRPCVPHHVRMDMFRNFLTNRLCHAPILRKECCYRIGRHLLLPPMDHGIEQRCLTVVILCWDGICSDTVCSVGLFCSATALYGFFVPYHASTQLDVLRQDAGHRPSYREAHCIGQRYHDMRIMNTRFRWSFCWKDWAVEAARSTPVRSGIQRFAREPPWRGILQAERYNDVCVQSICPAKSRKDRNAIKRWLRVETLHPRAFSSQVRKLRMTSRSTREKVSSAAPIPISSLI